MNFSSLRFAVFLAAILALFAFRFSHVLKKRALAFASCLFYAAWDYRYLALLLFVSVVDFVAASRIHRASASGRGAKRGWLALSVVSNLGLLGYFKYTNFFLDSLNGVLGPYVGALPHLDILLPAGISFYTFKTLSYTIDVYRGEIEPCRSLSDYAMFVTFFPELIAGPIVRASVFLPQMERPIGPTMENLRAGFSRFLLGFTKKRLIADTAAIPADVVFGSPMAFDCAATWLGVAAYAIQIYGDFSGYSDMAIGVARMLGYDLPENFDMPYIAADLSEFWRRWHITLSSWLRDYLYIPLGGNRHGGPRTYLNLFLTMLLGGLWHGASWNFVLWGALHGGALAVHRGYRALVGKGFTLPRPLATFITLAFVVFAWIPFRAKDFGTTWEIVRRLFTPGAAGMAYRPILLFIALAVVIVAHVAGAALGRRAKGGPALSPSGPAGPNGALDRVLAALGFTLRTSEISGWYVELGFTRFVGAFVLFFWILGLYFFIPTTSAPFIYFQF